MSLCQVMQVSRSGYYAWRKCPAKLITADVLHLYRRTKALFAASRNSLGNREMMKKLREEGFAVGRYRTRTVMRRLGLKVQQRVLYKVTTQCKHSDAVADDLLNRNFNPVGPNHIWAGDITYLRTGEGWLYLAVVMDLYARRIVGWAVDKRMTQALVSRVMIQAINLRQPPRGLVFHSDRGSQYTSRTYRALLASQGLRTSMGKVGACWDNAVVERFFGSLKHDWLLKAHQPTRDHTTQDVAAYIRYYNNHRLHTANNSMSPVSYEMSKLKMSRIG